MIVPMTAEHLAAIELQPAQAAAQAFLSDESYVAALSTAGHAYALLGPSGEVLACAGIIPMWHGRAIAWALVGAAAGHRMVELHRAAMRAFDMHPVRRLETTVAAGFEQGHRWARLLGFTRECTMRAYAPDGSDCDLYARVT